MELIIKVDEKRYEEIKQIANAQLELKNKTEAQIIANGTPYNPTGDAISREDLINAKPEFLNEKVVRDTKYRTTKSRIYAKAWSACNSEWLNTIKNAPTVEPRDNFDLGYVKGLADAKSDIITLIANEYTEHGELIPNWLTIGETTVADRQKKGGAE